MKFLRTALRKIKYRLKFIGINKNLDFSYVSSAKTNQELKKYLISLLEVGKKPWKNLFLTLVKKINFY